MTGDEFERLLGELSAEFNRLRQENIQLARENSDLRNPEKTKTTAPEGFHGEDSSTCGVPNNELDVEDSGSNNFKRPLALPASSSKLDVPEGRIQKDRSTRSTQSVESLREQFCRLDCHSTGHLTFEEVSGILERSEQPPVEPAVLAETIRFLSAATEDWKDWRSPATFDGAVGKADSTQRRLTMDFQAYVKLMQIDSSSGEALSSSLQDCIHKLRRACRGEVGVTSSLGSSQSALPTSCGRLKSDFWRETVPTVVIVINAIMTGFAVDYSDPKTSERYDVWDICEFIFCAFYSLEFILKLLCVGCRGYFFGPEFAWNGFDFACLMISWAEIVTTFLSTEPPNELNHILLIKIFRLGRLARPLRTLRFKLFKELKLMVMGVFSGLRVLFWAIVLLGIITYLVAVGITVAFQGAREDIKPREFDSVPTSMFTLFRCWTEGCAAEDGTPLAETLRRNFGWTWFFFHVLTTMFVTVGVFNLIMAIFIENVVTAQGNRRHAEMGQKTQEVEVKLKQKFAELITMANARRHATFRRSISARVAHQLDSAQMVRTSHRGNLSHWETVRATGVTVCREVFLEWLKSDELDELLQDSEIETANKVELFEVLDTDMDNKLSMDELITGLMKLRGPVTKADIVAVRLKVRHLTKLVEKDLHINEDEEEGDMDV